MKFNAERIILFAFLMVLFSFSANAASSKIGILVFNGVLTSDVTAPIEVFGAATKKSWFSSYEVVVISAEEGLKIKTEEGLNIVADITIDEKVDLDVLLVPSSYNMKPLLRNRDLVQYIKSKGRKASWVASNCSGAFLLAESGLLNGIKATTWFGGEKELKDKYPLVDVQFNSNVVIDKNVITSNGGAVSYQAALKLLEKLSSPKFSKEISEAIQLNRLKQAAPPNKSN